MSVVVNAHNVVEALVYTLYDSCDAARDLYQTLKIKEKRDYEQSLRSKGYPSSRRIEFVDDESFGKDANFALEKVAITQQFEVGYRKYGEQFLVGDLLSQMALQAQIIKLQSVVVDTCLYGPTSRLPISQQLAKLSLASTAASISSVDILAAQTQRQQAQLPPSPRSSHSPVRRSYHTSGPIHTDSTDTRTTPSSLVKYEGQKQPRSSSPVNTTILGWRQQTDTETTSMTGSKTMSLPPDLYCPYAMDLERHPSKQLSASILQPTQSPHCPHCDNALHLSPGKAWEVRKDDGGDERLFQVSNRFVVKCHRSGADGQYSCILCTRHDDRDSVCVCGDVKALIKHIWEDHSIAELKHEEDITEVVELAVDRRRDSGTGHSAARSNRRSASLGPSSWRGKHGYERETDAHEVRSSRWAR